jgi:glycosyltransferase involved in cell wall biosynthesis
MPQAFLPVSAIVPAYRASGTIVAALESIGTQSALPREIVVIDDASDDAAALEAAVRGFAARSRVPVLLERLATNRGPAAARNAGWNIASADSDYVAFLDADDRWTREKLRHQIAWMQAHPGIAWSAHRCAVGTALPSPEAPRAPLPLQRRRLLTANPIATPTVVVDRRIGARFREDLRHCEDLMLWIDLLDTGYPGVLLGETLAELGRVPLSPGGLTHDLAGMHVGAQHVLDTLQREHRLPAFDHAVLQVWETLRYLRRRLRGMGP